MSLFTTAERLAALDHSRVTLKSDLCLHTQDRFSSCNACYNICPVEAITAGKPPSLNPDKCESCLACLTICQVGAYRADDAVAPLLNAVTHLEGNALELVCDRNPSGERGLAEENTGIRIRGCLAGMGTGAYLALAAIGLENILVRVDGCSTCRWGSLSRQVDAQVNHAKRLLEGWGKAEILEIVGELESPRQRPLWEATNPPLSRRDMFRMLAQQGKVAMGRAIDNGQTSPGLHPGKDRVRVTGALAHLPSSQAGFPSRLTGMNFATVSVSETCTACGACGRACPTGALQFEKNKFDTVFSIKILTRNCIGCEVCVHVCAASALTVDHSPTFSQIFDDEITLLQECALVKCEHCGSLIADRDNMHLCPLCTYRQTHPFGSVMLPELQGIKASAEERKPE